MSDNGDGTLYLGLDAESFLTVGAGGYADVPVEIDGTVRTVRVQATGNLGKRIRDVRLRLNGGGRKQAMPGKKELG